MPEFLNTGERLRAEDALRAEAWAAEARKEREPARHYLVSY